ncbi:MAG: hypothetical protein HY040_12625 [Planctomycetes bacterium]|nr:hypothetical protein [Planctomycetota bacterium]
MPHLLERAHQKSVAQDEASVILKHAEGLAGPVGGGVEDAGQVNGFCRRREIEGLIQRQRFARRSD